jgi:hypothetical protein
MGTCALLYLNGNDEPYIFQFVPDCGVMVAFRDIALEWEIAQTEMPRWDRVVIRNRNRSHDLDRGFRYMIRNAD